MTTFYLVRHAHSEWTSDENRPLSVKGSQDAQRVAHLLHTYPINAIYSSPERRAYQTISPLAERIGIKIKIEAELRERKLGDEVFEDFLGAVEATWYNPYFSYLGGESSNDAQKRGFAIVQHLLNRYPADHIVLSTHGNLLALILQAFDPSVDFMFWKSLSMPDIYALIIGQTGTVKFHRRWL